MEIRRGTGGAAGVQSLAADLLALARQQAENRADPGVYTQARTADPGRTDPRFGPIDAAGILPPDR